MSGKKRKGYRLNVQLHFSQPLLRSGALDVLQAALADAAPRWAADMHAWVQGEAIVPVSVDRRGDLSRVVDAEVDKKGSLYAELQRRFGGTAAPLKSGMVEFRGGDGSLIVIVSVDERPLIPRGQYGWMWGNTISLQLCSTHVEGQPAGSWALAMVQRMCELAAPIYGHAEMLDEFYAKNMQDDDKGLRAVGVNPLNGLPGLYWLNVYGEPYVALFGRDRLLSAPGARVDIVGSTIVVMLSEAPEEWCSPTCGVVERSVVEHLGEDCFFSKAHPERALRSPALLHAWTNK